MIVQGTRRDKLSQRDAGFTLVELVVAMLVIAIVLIAIITVQARALTTNADSQARQSATAYANEAMEQFRSMPWDTLRNGLAPDFNVGGTDPFVNALGAEITVNGKSYPLIVAPSMTGFDSGPWPPLFVDSSGSNASVKTSPSGNGDLFTVRGYTTVDESLTPNTVGLVVIVSWKSRSTGATQDTVLTSAAFASTEGCGSPQNSPYLAACQAVFDASASTGQVVVGAKSTNLDVVEPASVPLVPGDIFYKLDMATSTASANISSVQVSTATGVVSYGGTIKDDNLESTRPSDFSWVKGYDSHVNKASDDGTSGAPHLNWTEPTFSSSASDAAVGSGDLKLKMRSDNLRGSKIEASGQSACLTKFLGASTSYPCAHSNITGIASDTGSYLTVGSKDLRLVQVNSSNSVDNAWASRFVYGAGDANVGCTSIAGSGCAAAGANREIGNIVVGQVVGGTWAEGAVNEGLVVIQNYSDSAMAQRGTGTLSSDTLSKVERSASLRYWNGTEYKNQPIATNTTFNFDVPQVSYDEGLYTITAATTIKVFPAPSPVVGSTDAACLTTECTISLANGSIEVTVHYTITPDDPLVASFELEIVTVVNGSQASASFKEAPSA